MFSSPEITRCQKGRLEITTEMLLIVSHRLFGPHLGLQQNRLKLIHQWTSGLVNARQRQSHCGVLPPTVFGSDNDTPQGRARLCRMMMLPTSPKTGFSFQCPHCHLAHSPERSRREYWSCHGPCRDRGPYTKMVESFTLPSTIVLSSSTIVSVRGKPVSTSDLVDAVFCS